MPGTTGMDAGIGELGRGGATLAIGRQALVVFEDRTDARVLRCLRPGFRHCFCLTGNGTLWTLCDPLKSRLALATIDGLGAAELAEHFATGGRTVILGAIADGTSPGRPSLRPVTCVEIVKRLVGLRTARVTTPYQLYRRLLDGAPGEPPFTDLTARGELRQTSLTSGLL